MGVFDLVGTDLGSIDIERNDDIQVAVAGTLATATHLEALAWAMGQAGPGAVLEVGSGFYSTPVLHGWAEAQGRWLCTVETEFAWASQWSVRYPQKWHRFDVQRRGKIELPSEHYALAIVDGISEDRAAWIRALYDHSPTTLVVVHDTEPTRAEELPGVREALEDWPNRKDWTHLYPFTTAVWR